MGTGDTKGHTWALESERKREHRPGPAAMALRELGPPASTLQLQEGEESCSRLQRKLESFDPEPSEQYDVLL